MILLQAEVLDLKANPNKPARGTVIEARLDRGRGPIATVLIDDGSLHIGDFFVAGATYGKVRAMMDHRGTRLKEALPGTPVEVMGFTGLPDVSDSLAVVESETVAKQVSTARDTKRKHQMLVVKPKKLSLNDLFDQVNAGDAPELKIILKADVHGSAMAIKESLEKLTNPSVSVNVIHQGVGAISETDVMFASASDAIIVGFMVRPAAPVQALAESEGVEIRLFTIIYNVVEEVQAAMKGLLKPKFEEMVMGHAEVRKTFNIPNKGRVAGVHVTDGKIVRNMNARLIRDGVEIYSGKVQTLRRFQDDAKEVTSGYECGVGLENYMDLKVNDVIEVYDRKEVPATM